MLSHGESVFPNFSPVKIENCHVISLLIAGNLEREKLLSMTNIIKILLLFLLFETVTFCLAYSSVI